MSSLQQDFTSIFKFILNKTSDSLAVSESFSQYFYTLKLTFDHQNDI